MGLCMCYMTDKTKTYGLHRCASVYLHAIGLTRQRDEGYIECI